MIDAGAYIVESNLSTAWAKAFLKSIERRQLSPLIVTVNGFSHGLPFEDAGIRGALDKFLSSNGCYSVHTVANTIFPSLWRPGIRTAQLFQRYTRILPRLRKHAANRNGIYFERMISYGEERRNQLEHVIQTWKIGNHRRSAHFACIVDPLRDHTHQRQRGFPCLLHVAFGHDDSGGFSLTGYYGTQYIVERAYGNYLGLCRLGRFMADAFRLELRSMTCVAAFAIRGEIAKSRMKNLVAVSKDKITSEASFQK